MGSSDTVTVLGVVCVRDPHPTGCRVYRGRTDGGLRVVAMDMLDRWVVSVERTGFGRIAEGRAPALHHANEACITDLARVLDVATTALDRAQAQREPMARVA
jgi:hypothetical protein